jgi:uncharacterized protein DUF5829
LKSRTPTATYCTSGVRKTHNQNILLAIIFMKVRVLFTIVILASLGRLNGQTNDSAKVVISHIFFCIDSVTYQNLFKSDFIAKTFAYCRESSSKTTTDSWTGKYLLGRRSYVEVFAVNDKKPQPELGDKFADAAIVFRTKKPGDIHKIDSEVKADKHDTHLELMKYESDGKTIPFNYNLYLSNVTLQEVFRAYVEEFTTDFLELCGFDESDIKEGITAEQFGEKRRGGKYEKLFDNIKKIELTLRREEFDYLAESLKYFGFTQIGNLFTNGGLQISCSLQQNRTYKLKAIHFTLLSKVDSTRIEISKNLTFKASGTTGSFEFNY